MPTFASRALLEGLKDVVGCVLTNGDGLLLEEVGAVTEAELRAANAASLAQEMTRLGVALGLGSAETVTIQAASGTHIVGMRGESVAAIEIDPRRQSADIERRLHTCDWAPASEPPEPPPAPPEPPPARPELPHAGSAERPAVFSGNLQLFAVPDLLEFLRNGQRTGTLICRSRTGVGTVQLSRGRVVNAMSPAAGGLAEALVRAGRLAPEQVNDVTAGLENVPPPDTTVSRLLLEKGLATTADLRGALLARIHRAIREIVTWIEGRFAFDTTGPVEPAFPGSDVELDSQPILLNIYREQDEANKPR